MKKKIILMVALVVVFVAMISVGFAGWQISTYPDSKTASAGVQTEEVVDSSYTLSDLSPDAENFQFGVPASQPNTTYHWLTYTTDSVYEDLDIIVSGKVGKTNGTLEDLSEIVVTYSGDNLTATIKGTTVQIRAVLTVNDTSDLFTAANGLVTSPAITAMTISNVGALKVTIGCSWGDSFKPSGEDAGVNPFVYYNNQAYSTSLAQAASTNLGKIADLSGVSLTLTIYVEAVSA